MSKSKRERKELVNKANPLSVKRQIELLELSRSSYYYQPKGESELNLQLMRKIDEEHLEKPWLGVPRITEWIRKDVGIQVNPKRIERLFKLLEISAIYPKPRTSKMSKGEHHKVYPYLLRNKVIHYPNQVWAMDITYVPTRGGFLYLNAIIDVHSRYIVGWSLSNTMTAEWCRNTLQEAIEKYGEPEVVNTDQGSQFTSKEFCQYLEERYPTMQISMDGRGRAIDNIFIERFWRSAKYEHIYLNPSEDGLTCYKGISDYMSYYNQSRRHQSLGYETPGNIYFKDIKSIA
jgi:putative transposase